MPRAELEGLLELDCVILEDVVITVMARDGRLESRVNSLFSVCAPMKQMT